MKVKFKENVFVGSSCVRYVVNDIAEIDDAEAKELKKSGFVEFLEGEKEETKPEPVKEKSYDKNGKRK